jgi:hypothetical protein
MKAFDKKKLANKIFFTNWHTKIFGLDLNPAWIRIQQQAGSGPKTLKKLKLNQNKTSCALPT